MNQKQTLQSSAILGALAVIIGAFGAHTFKPMLISHGRLDTYELAVRYQFFHVLALLALGILMKSNTSKKLTYASLFFLSGVILFCGSLYALCFTGITVLGAVTPFGGVFFILGWVFLLLGVSTKSI